MRIHQRYAWKNPSFFSIVTEKFRFSFICTKLTLEKFEIWNWSFESASTPVIAQMNKFTGNVSVSTQVLGFGELLWFRASFKIKIFFSF